MDQHPRNVPAPRTAAGLEDARDLRAALDAALATSPVNERRLRDAIFNYVGAERDAGTSPGRVILDLTESVEAAETVPAGDVPALLRGVILWCVEAYFGHLGRDVFGGRGDTPRARESDATG